MKDEREIENRQDAWEEVVLFCGWLLVAFSSIAVNRSLKISYFRPKATIVERQESGCERWRAHRPRAIDC
jgi:hypothetical protein